MEIRTSEMKIRTSEMKIRTSEMEITFKERLKKGGPMKPLFNIKEKSIEVYLRDSIKALGGKAYKWVSPGSNGVPDRIVVMPLGLTFFVELKSPTGRLNPTQIMQHRTLAAMGHRTYVLSTKDEVDEFIVLVKRYSGHR